MSKRHLSNQQKSRIAENQQSEFNSSGTTDSVVNTNWNGRVISHFGQQLDIEVLKGKDAGSVIRCYQRANLPALVAGDNVVWEPNINDLGIIVAQAERRNVFGRQDVKGEFKPIAANLDCVLIVLAVIPEAFLNLLDRYLVAVTHLRLEPLIVLNKTDLLAEKGNKNLDNILAIYAKLGYTILKVSALKGTGIHILEEQLGNKTTVLVGQSGVGKSSLINRLGFKDLATVGDLSSSKYKGTHTTTTARLFHLRNFDLIDSPGIRDFSLGQMGSADVLNGFIELQKFAIQCKFGDCKHADEPGCALRPAIENGEVSKERFDSYRQILRSMT